ncbi:ComF family protein [Streptomyces fradiae]|uniref:ComF family protein n=1 Tax=Streptomyces fradiae TaxID=1906 RepID=UPI003F4D063A
MRGWWQEITGLVLPVACAGCGRPRTTLCDVCARSLRKRPAAHVRPEPEPGGLPDVWAAAPYEGAVRAALLAHKERGALALAAPLGEALAGAARAAAVAAAAAGLWPGGVAAVGGAASMGAEAVEGAGGGGVGVGALPLALVPVPSARRSVRARGHDAVRRVAVAAARELRRTGIEARVAPVLRQRRVVADQAGLGARQRHANLAGALEVVPGGARLLAGARVVLVDDLMTTGATLNEAARALCEAGTVREAGMGRGAAPDFGVGPACEAGGQGGAGAGSGTWAVGGTRDGRDAGTVRETETETETETEAVRRAGMRRIGGMRPGGGPVILRGTPGRRRANGGDLAGVRGTFGTSPATCGPGRGELPRGDHGGVLIGAAVVAASPKAFADKPEPPNVVERCR